MFTIASEKLTPRTFTAAQVEEELPRIFGKSLSEYMRTPRIGATFTLNRLERAIFYRAVREIELRLATTPNRFWAGKGFASYEEIVREME